MRALRVEFLEARTVMTALPFGATPDDTGEFMLGDVHVSVVLMESNNAIDNGTIAYSGSEEIQYTPENWTLAAKEAVKQNILTGLNWWKDTLDALPGVRDGLLNFTFDWSRWENPVQTPYEPIARRSEDVESANIRWINSFFASAPPEAGLTTTGAVSANIRKFNNYQRQLNNADWAFTIIVVNNENDLAADSGNDSVPTKFKGGFATSGQFANAFSFAGGRYMVVPASRPPSTYAHETGHMFWALDEYEHGGTYASSRGYYNTPNSNAWNNPETGFVQQPSIMTNDVPEPVPPALPSFLLSQAYNTHTTSRSSAEMIGWRDTDGDGIFDVLDVPFELTGSGRFDATSGTYRFIGSSSVRTLPNLNPTFLQNDITINRIREVQYAIDGGEWQTNQSFASEERIYKLNLDLAISDPALTSPGSHTIRIRTIDTRTGAMSPEFVGTIAANGNGTPTAMPSSDAGTSGYVFFDSDGDGSWDRNEGPIVDWAIDLVDPFGTVVSLQRQVEPDDYLKWDVLNNVRPEVTLSAVGSDTFRNEVQRLTFTIPLDGTVTPEFNGVLGTPLSPISPALFVSTAQVAASLNAIPALAGNVLVSGFGVGIFEVTFNGALSGFDVPLITQGAATGGAALSAQTVAAPQLERDVYALEIAPGSQKPLGFGNYTVNPVSGFTTTWTTSRRFRADFASPVSRVSLKALFGGGGASYSVGRLEAYNAAGELLERYTTKVLTGGSETMTVALPTANIAYVLAYGHLGSEVALDTLVWGPRSSATTNMQGAWSLSSLLTGTYRVKVTPPLGHIVTTPQGGQFAVAYTEGVTVGDLNFGIYNTDNIWHNTALPQNVNADPLYVVNTIDMLVVINWLTTNGPGAPLPQTGDPNVTGYVDVNNDKVCNTTDLLNLINYLTLHPPGGAPAASGSAGAPSGVSGLGGGPGSEGEKPAESVWSDFDSLQLSPAYLLSREDVHVHDDGDEYTVHDDQESALVDGGGSNPASEFDFGGGEILDSGLTGDILSGWLDSNEGSGSLDLSPVVVDEHPSPSVRGGVPPTATSLVDVAEGLVPLARRKRLELSIDMLAEDLLAVAARNVRILARGTRR